MKPDMPMINLLQNCKYQKKFSCTSNRFRRSFSWLFVLTRTFVLILYVKKYVNNFTNTRQISIKIEWICYFRGLPPPTRIYHRRALFRKTFVSGTIFENNRCWQIGRSCPIEFKYMRMRMFVYAAMRWILLSITRFCISEKGENIDQAGWRTTILELKRNFWSSHCSDCSLKRNREWRSKDCSNDWYLPIRNKNGRHDIRWSFE